MAEITQVWATNYQDGLLYGSEWVERSDGRDDMWAGYKYADSNWVICIKFILPVDVESFTFHFHNADALPGIDAIMRYKITTLEDVNLKNATASTPGDGSFTIDNSQDRYHLKNSITFARKLSAGTYFMYIWTDQTTAYPNNWMNIRWRLKEYDGFYATYAEVGTGYVTEFYQKQYKDGELLTDWILLDGTVNIVAGYLQGHNWVSVLRFDLPDSIKQLTISFVIAAANTTGDGSIRYKVVSGSEDSSLVNADVNTEADGTFTLDARNDYDRNTFTIDKSVSKGTTYLYLWTNRSAGVENGIGIRGYAPDDEDYGTTGFYRIGGYVIYIDNGTSFDAYEIWIDNGTKWEQYQAFIDNGSSWDECG